MLYDRIGRPETPGASRVLRGGAFYNEPRNLRSAYRNRNRPENSNRNIGFRCVRRARRQHADRQSPCRACPGLRARHPLPARSGRLRPTVRAGLLMRSVKAGSFERLASVEALWRAWKSYRRGKRRKPRVAAFDLDADRHIFALHRDLRRGAYRPGGHRVAVIHDPKTRLIAAQPIRDCVVQQALLDDVGGTYDRGFIDHAFACCSGRGPLRAVLCYLDCTRRYRYRLALDIRRYFLSVHRPTLKWLICRRLRDERTRRLVGLLVDSGGEVYRLPLAVKVLCLEQDPLPPEAGMPIGSYLSQWSGSLYLDALDHFVKRQLKIPGYLRFMDDFTLFGGKQAQLLAARSAVAAWLERERRLELNPKRGAVVPAAQPSTYLGYRVSRGGLQPSRKLKRRLRRRVRAVEQQGPKKLGRSLRSYRGLMTFG